MHLPTPGLTLDYVQTWIREYGCNVYVHSIDVRLFAAKLHTDLTTLGDAVKDKIVRAPKVSGKKFDLSSALRREELTFGKF